MTSLKRCRECGSRSELVRDNVVIDGVMLWYVACKKRSCGNKSAKSESENEIVNRWNKSNDKSVRLMIVKKKAR